jgi:hypothetical protein
LKASKALLKKLKNASVREVTQETFKIKNFTIKFKYLNEAHRKLSLSENNILIKESKRFLVKILQSFKNCLTKACSEVLGVKTTTWSTVFFQLDFFLNLEFSKKKNIYRFYRIFNTKWIKILIVIETSIPIGVIKD